MLLLALGLFGALGYGLALLLLPKIHSTIRTLQVALTPTHQLLYGEPVTRETPWPVRQQKPSRAAQARDDGDNGRSCTDAAHSTSCQGLAASS
jgi:hypothetical protein